MVELSRTNDPNASSNTAHPLSSFLPVSCVNDIDSNHKQCDTDTKNGGFSTGVHLFPFRTEQLSPVAPMVLPSPAGESVAANLFKLCPPRLRAAGGICVLAPPAPEPAVYPGLHPDYVFLGAG